MVNYMKQSDLVDTIREFESSNRDFEAYRVFLVKSSRAFKQGIGLDGKQIHDAIREALDGGSSSAVEH